MFLNFYKKSWVDGLILDDYNIYCINNENIVKEMLEFVKNYYKVLEEEEIMIKEQLVIKNVGKMDLKRYFEEYVDVLMIINIV